MDIKSLEYKINALRNTLEDTKKASTNIRLTPNDMESLCRLYKTLEYNLVDGYIDYEAFKESLLESSHSVLIRKWLKIMTESKFSYFTNFVQYKVPRFNSVTSMPLLAAKEKHNIPFNAWKSCPTKYLFYQILEDGFKTLPLEEEYKRIKFSQDLLVAAKPRGDLQSYTIGKVGTKFEGEDEDGPIYLWEGFDSWPIIFRHMKLQTWIFHPQFRSVDSMILDPYDWEYIPDPNYGGVDSRPKKKPDDLGDLCL